MSFKNIAKKNVYKQLPNDLKVNINDTLENYRHLTFKINNLSEYLNIISVISPPQNNIYDDAFIFRGMSDYQYDLKPSLARLKGLYIENVENLIVEEATTLRPEEFSENMSNFDLLSKLQHYGFPTRLLDFTLNPLVALYFACVDNNKKTGRVICTCKEKTSMEVIESICSIHKINDFAGQYIENIHKNIGHYLNSVCFPCVAVPKYSNDRIKRQSAVFMIFPNKLYDVVGKNTYLESYLKTEDIVYGYEMNEERRRQIDSIKLYEDAKKIYPEISDYFNYDFSVTPKVYRSLYKQYNIEVESKEFITKVRDENFKKRFSVLSDIQPLNPESVENDFCSILIKQKVKNKIMKELAVLGIDEAFLFPELEYTAKKIKNKYK